MKSLNFSRCTLIGCIAGGMLAACGGSQPPIGAPGAMPQTSTTVTHAEQLRDFRIAGMDAPHTGIYVSESQSSHILGYPENNPGNKPPICRKSASSANGVAVDGRGNLIVPHGLYVTVFKGPGMCGPELGSIGMSEGNPVSAASADAANGTIAVAVIQDGSGNGSIELCTLNGGCNTNLTNPQMNFVEGVALANNGDCWASSQQYHYSGAVLTYFKGCSGAGESATGFENVEAGGLDIDKNGNLVAISSSTSSSASAIYVYSGCMPACKLVGGPFSLHGKTVSGHLNEDSSRLAAADYEYGQVDIYRYTPRSVTYLYSFNNSMSPSENVTSAAYNPRSKE
jgi:hypothetical protein